MEGGLHSFEDPFQTSNNHRQPCFLYLKFHLMFKTHSVGSLYCLRLHRRREAMAMLTVSLLALPFAMRDGWSFVPFMLFLAPTPHMASAIPRAYMPRYI